MSYHPVNPVKKIFVFKNVRQDLQDWQDKHGLAGSQPMQMPSPEGESTDFYREAGDYFLSCHQGRIKYVLLILLLILLILSKKSLSL